MIQNLSKSELIELNYDLIAENKQLIELVNGFGNRENKAIRYIKSMFYKPIAMYNLYKYNNQLNNNITRMRNLTESELSKAFESINKFENKQMNYASYKQLFTTVTGVEVCNKCGVTAERLHNDLQRAVLNQIKSKYPNMVKPIVFYSGKYASGDFYSNNVPFYTYLHMNNLINKMKVEYKGLEARGFKEESALLLTDTNNLIRYMEDRKTNYAAKEEVLKPVFNIEVFAEALSEVLDANIVVTNTDLNDDSKESNAEVITTVELVEESAVMPIKQDKGGIKFDKYEAERMKFEDAMTVTQIAAHFGVSKSYVSQQLKKV